MNMLNKNIQNVYLFNMNALNKNTFNTNILNIIMSNNMLIMNVLNMTMNMLDVNEHVKHIRAKHKLVSRTVSYSLASSLFTIHNCTVLYLRVLYTFVSDSICIEYIRAGVRACMAGYVFIFP